VALVEHRGATVLFEALGRLRPDGEQPMARDSLFRIYSMTKPIVSLAALMLMEQGRLQLAHPVSRYLPSFAKQTVWTPRGAAAGAARGQPARSAAPHRGPELCLGRNAGGPGHRAARMARAGTATRSWPRPWGPCPCCAIPARPGSTAAPPMCWAPCWR
jgi:hypothetical protein